jgi:hypothetical protein
MKIRDIKLQIKKLARNFDLRYQKEWFQYLWISTCEEILSEYIGDCPDPIYWKYGKTKEDKIKHIDKFLASKDFKSCLKRVGGSVASKKSTKEQLKLINKIPNKKIKEEMLKLYNKVNKKIGKADYIALLTRTKIKKHYEWQMKYGLRHEWIHILLGKNKIKFQEIDKKLWPYDEGINEYLGAYIDNNLNKLEKLRDKEKYPMEKKNWIYAIKFKKILQDKKTPKDRKKALKELMKRLR